MSCYFGNLEATFTRELLVVKGWLLGEAGDHLTNNIITNILNFIYQWLHNCWCWRGDYLGRLEATLEYSNSHLSLTGQLLVVKGWLLGEAGGFLTNNTITNILNVIYQWLHNCWCWRGDYLGSLEATLQYSNSHLSLTGQLFVVKGWLLGEAVGCLPNNIIINILNFIYQWVHNCWCWRGDYLGRLEATLQYSNSHLSLTGQLLVVKGWPLEKAGGCLTNIIITNILYVIYQWMGNCWCWRGDYLGRLEMPPYNILTLIYQWLGNCWWWRGGYWRRLEAPLQYSKFHISLTGHLLVVKRCLLGEPGSHLTIF